MENRNIHGWILNPVSDRNHEDGKPIIFKATKKEGKGHVTIFGTYREIKAEIEKRG